MMTKALRHKCIRAGSAYLTMSGYEIVEEGWHQGKYSIDIIAQKNQIMHFLTVYYVKDDLDSQQDYYTEAEEITKLKAVESWLESNKYADKYATGDITMLGNQLSVIGAQISATKKSNI